MDLEKLEKREGEDIVTDVAASTVFIVEDDKIACCALQGLVTSVGLSSEIYHGAPEFLEHFSLERRGCLLLDVRLPLMCGLELQEKLVNMGSALSVIVMTAYADIPMAVRAMRQGASDFLVKPFNNQHLLEKIQRAILQNAAVYDKLTRQREVQAAMQKLTAREKQVLELVMEGRLNKEIGYELNISLSTVELHRSKIMQKMQAKTIAELVKLYCIATEYVK